MDWGGRRQKERERQWRGSWDRFSQSTRKADQGGWCRAGSVRGAADNRGEDRLVPGFVNSPGTAGQHASSKVNLLAPGKDPILNFTHTTHTTSSLEPNLDHVSACVLPLSFSPVPRWSSRGNLKTPRLVGLHGDPQCSAVPSTRHVLHHCMQATVCKRHAEARAVTPLAACPAASSAPVPAAPACASIPLSCPVSPLWLLGSGRWAAMWGCIVRQWGHAAAAEACSSSGGGQGMGWQQQGQQWSRRKGIRRSGSGSSQRPGR